MCGRHAIMWNSFCLNVDCGRYKWWEVWIWELPRFRPHSQLCIDKQPQIIENETEIFASGRYLSIRFCVYCIRAFDAHNWIRIHLDVYLDVVRVLCTRFYNILQLFGLAIIQITSNWSHEHIINFACLEKFANNSLSITYTVRLKNANEFLVPHLLIWFSYAIFICSASLSLPSHPQIFIVFTLPTMLPSISTPAQGNYSTFEVKFYSIRVICLRLVSIFRPFPCIWMSYLKRI